MTSNRLDEFDTRVETMPFCNGLHCAATPRCHPDAAAAGYPAESLLYYRGGIHDWVMLGLPVERLYTGDADVPERNAPVRT
jgi:hypothetical protein